MQNCQPALQQDLVPSSACASTVQKQAVSGARGAVIDMGVAQPGSGMSSQETTPQQIP